MIKKLLFLCLIVVCIGLPSKVFGSAQLVGTGQDCPKPVERAPGMRFPCKDCEIKYCKKDQYEKPTCIHEKWDCIPYVHQGGEHSCWCDEWEIDKGTWVRKKECFVIDPCAAWKGCVSREKNFISWGCESQKDCFEGCPADKPDWPHMKCDHKTKKCIVVNSCGKNECKTYSDCCGSKEKYPHYKCIEDNSIWGSKLFKCEKQNYCGVDECDPKNTKYSVMLGSHYSPDCRSYECKVSSAGAQCVINNRGKYANRLFCEKDCQAQSTTTTTVITTTTTKASPGTTLPVVTTTKASVGPGNGGTSTTTTTKKIPTTTTTTLLPFCTINALEFVKYTQGGFRSNFYTKVFALLNIPKDKILTNPKFEYAASNCEECFLDIINLDNGKKVTQFYIDNKSFGKLDDDGLINPSIKNRYLFERGTFYQNGLDLNVSSLYPGRYEIILKCVDPSDRDYKIEQSLRLNVFPSIRWRESLPAID